MPVEEFKAWKDKTADSEKTMVEELAYVAVLKARTEFKERQEITNRTEGMPKQTIKIDDDEGLDDKLKEINDSINKKLVGNTESNKWFNFISDLFMPGRPYENVVSNAVKQGTSQALKENR